MLSLQFVEIIGFAASGLVFLTFCMQTLLPLRMVATFSNILFIIYAAFAGLAPILILHALLLPVNVWRLSQQLLLRRRIRQTFTQPTDIGKLLPFMTLEKFEPGAVIFDMQDPADRLYVVVEAEVAIDDMEKVVKKGELFGEIGLFSSQGQRTSTVHAVGRVSAAWISRSTAIKIFEDHPDFALMLTKLITSRLIDNQTQLRDMLQAKG
mgnify:CR=1 FL=1